MKSEDIPVVGAIVEIQTKEEIINGSINGIPIIESQSREAAAKVMHMGKDAAIIYFRQQMLKWMADYLASIPQRIAIRVESELRREYQLPGIKHKK